MKYPQWQRRSRQRHRLQPPLRTLRWRRQCQQEEPSIPARFHFLWTIWITIAIGTLCLQIIAVIITIRHNMSIHRRCILAAVRSLVHQRNNVSGARHLSLVDTRSEGLLVACIHSTLCIVAWCTIDVWLWYFEMRPSKWFRHWRLLVLVLECGRLKCEMEDTTVIYP